MTTLNWLTDAAKTICDASIQAATEHQQQLTKPAGSLGQLETLTIRFAGFQGVAKPVINHKYVRIFAGDHGIAANGVSAFPQEVTAQMVHNFLSGGAAISVLSQQHHADFKVCNMGLIDSPAASALTAHPLLESINVGKGTHDFSTQPAMTQPQLEACLEAGKQCAENFQHTQSVFVGGEMGIGNTTSASAIYSVLLALTPTQSVGPGTGVNNNVIKQKAALIKQAIKLHGVTNQTAFNQKPLEVLRTLGGFEIAALVGAYIHCAQRGIPILVDGFITTAAALVAMHINPTIKPWLVFTHCSAEPAHTLALRFFEQTPLIDLGLRLGEGSGAAVSLPILDMALNLHSNMATFASAGVDS